ncbi:MAG: Holliday junction branch migration protein RuvA [Clostridiales bacterium]|nr:Holliday junction branch migration protein RuvA [Candidatus Blautia equi]
MIAFVRGIISEFTDSSVILDTGSIGYEINMPARIIEELHIGEERKIHTYFQVREDAMQLYGFLRKDDLEMFKMLLTVNGVGPKAALGILSGSTADNLRFAVLSDDIKTISKIPGIGRKTAQKLILELKDKLNLEDAFEMKLAHEQGVVNDTTLNVGPLRDGYKEAVEALVALGYSSTDAMRAVRAVKDIDPSDVEAILKAALKNF